MKLELGNDQGLIHIRGYGKGFIDLPSERATRSLIVTPTQLIRSWPPQQFAELRDEHLEIMLSFNPEIILLGCGAKVESPAFKWATHFSAMGIGFEAMDTGAACRSFNVLASEGRNVAAALFIIAE